MKKILLIGALLLAFFSGCMEAEKISFDASTPSGSIFSLVVGAASAAANAGTSTGTGTAGTSVTYTVSGTIAGYTGSGLVLQNNAGDNLAPASGATTFSFATKVADKGAYSVTVSTQPTSTTPPLNCTVAGGSGTIAGANITGVSVTCAYAGAQFVAVGDNGNAWWSNDGMNWMATSFTGGTPNMKSVAFSGSKWVAVGWLTANGGCAVWSSDDGKSWTRDPCASGALAMNAVAYGKGMFLAGGQCNHPSNGTMTSTDGVYWTLTSTNFNNNCNPTALSSITSIVFDKTSNQFYSSVNPTVGGTDVLTYGTSGWGSGVPTSLSLGIKLFTSSVGGLFALGAGSISCTISPCDQAGSFSSPTWSYGGLGTFGVYKSLAYGNGKYVAVGDDGFGTCKFSSATNITTWAAANQPTGCSTGGGVWTSSAFHKGKNLFVAGGVNQGVPASDFIYSSDGMIWNWKASGVWNSTSPVNAIGVAE